MSLQKAELIEIEWNEDEPVVAARGRRIRVQFNPESLSVTYANQKAGGNQPGGSALQYVGQGTTKLSLDLWFDVNAPQPEGSQVADVRELTAGVIYFITPLEERVNGKSQWKAPGVRFLWGSFLFDGVMDALTEKLELFSEDGKPLRAQVSIGVTSQQIQFPLERRNGAAQGTATAGTQPMTAAPAGQPLQQVARGGGLSWQDIARANGLENPRRLQAGALLDLNVGVRADGRVQGSASAGFGPVRR